jgi:hypothetical protein
MKMKEVLNPVGFLVEEKPLFNLPGKKDRKVDLRLKSLLTKESYQRLPEKI